VGARGQEKRSCRALKLPEAAVKALKLSPGRRGSLALDTPTTTGISININNVWCDRAKGAGGGGD
jgi:hypothetical protein